MLLARKRVLVSILFLFCPALQSAFGTTYCFAAAGNRANDPVCSDFPNEADAVGNIQIAGLIHSKAGHRDLRRDGLAPVACCSKLSVTRDPGYGPIGIHLPTPSP